MYSLRKLDNGKWKIVSSKSQSDCSFEGSLSQVVSYSVINLGIEFEEVDTAASEINRYEQIRGDDSAEFGVMKNFIFTYDSYSKSKREYSC